MDVWKQKPNWGDGGVKLTLQYNTNIVESRDGNESRTAGRFNPRVAVQFADVRWGDKGIDQRREHRAMMQKDSVAVPLWMESPLAITDFIPISGNGFGAGDGRGVGSDAIQNQLSLKFEGSYSQGITPKEEFTYPANYVEGSWWFITNGNLAFASKLTKIVDKKDPTRIALGFKAVDLYQDAQASGDLSFLTGWTARPCLPARITEKSSYTALTAQHSKTSVKFDAIPGQYKLPAVSPARTTIDGKEVFDFVQNWRTKPKVDLIANRDVIDNGRAAPWVNYSVQFVSQMIKLSFLNFTPEGTILFMDFFRRHRGMAKSFLFPGESRDFEIEEVLGANVLQLKAGQVQSLFDHYSFGDSGGFKGYISIKIGQTRINGVRQKVFIHRRVQGTSDALDQIILDEPLPVGFDLTQAIKCSILYTARFATDSLTISYKTPLQAEMNCGIQIIPFEDTP